WPRSCATSSRMASAWSASNRSATSSSGSSSKSRAETSSERADRTAHGFAAAALVATARTSKDRAPALARRSEPGLDARAQTSRAPAAYADHPGRRDEHDDAFDLLDRRNRERGGR